MELELRKMPLVNCVMTQFLIVTPVLPDREIPLLVFAPVMLNPAQSNVIPSLVICIPSVKSSVKVQVEASVQVPGQSVVLTMAFPVIPFPVIFSQREKKNLENPVSCAETATLNVDRIMTENNSTAKSFLLTIFLQNTDGKRPI